MPTYQYRCTECGEELEAVQKFSDDPLTVCPACQGSLRKVFSPVGIVFKGSGFYRNDSRKGSAADGAKDGAKDGTKKDKEPAAAKSETGSADSAKSGAKEPSSGSGSSGSGSGASGSGSEASGSSGAKKEAKSSSSTSAPAATGS